MRLIRSKYDRATGVGIVGLLLSAVAAPAILYLVISTFAAPLVVAGVVAALLLLGAFIFLPARVFYEFFKQEREESRAAKVAESSHADNSNSV